MPETALRAALHSRNLRLYAETIELIEKVTPLLWHSIGTFPSGTSHSPEHTLTVENIVSVLLPSDTLGGLTDDELQLLLLACHFHDLGMAGTEAENRSTESRDQARRDHAVRIGTLIREKWDVLGFRDQVVADILAEICRGHRPRKSAARADWNDLRTREIIAPFRSVRIRLLSALIYAADELHLGADRAPMREQDWLRIEDLESRRHWRRHQQIVGPDLAGEVVQFQARPTGVEAEQDLRKNVFRKALSAVRDARSQMELDGLQPCLREIGVEWCRDELWRIFVIQVLSDQIARSIENLISGVRAKFVKATASFDALEGLYIEIDGGDAAIESRIARIIQDDITSGQLIIADGPRDLYLLAPHGRPARRMFDAARSADVDASLFGGAYAATNEISLLSSAYGKLFAHADVVPRVRAEFGIDLAVEPRESQLRDLLLASPTTVRLLNELNLPPSVLVRRHALRLLTLAGSAMDLVRNPEMILERPVRTALKDVSRTVVEEHELFIRLVD